MFFRLATATAHRQLPPCTQYSLPTGSLWRASLLALGCGAAPKPGTAIFLKKHGAWIRAASRPNASKLARHK
ncbi:hypothetical protein F7R08_27950 [Pseudomonas extremorientalis]|nr:hypothetical protein F7R08_27950 [Pseudomonas extremorientalis]